MNSLALLPENKFEAFVEKVIAFKALTTRKTKGAKRARRARHTAKKGRAGR
jgi:hypothetical protein